MKRDVNFELLKIICALMVLVYHVINTLVPVEEFSMGKQFLIWSFFWGGGRIAVNTFVIISSWYLCDKEFKSSRIVSAWISTFLYSLIVGLYFAFATRDYHFLIIHLEPISTNVIWFMRAYILLLLMTPFLNLILKIPKLSKFIILMGVLFSIYKTLYPASIFNIGDGYTFLLIYIMTGYIKRNIEKYRISKINLLLIFLGVYFLNIFWYVFYHDIINVIPFLKNLGYDRYMFNRQIINLQCMLGGFSIFGLFMNFRIKGKQLSKIILWFSSGTLGVYIFLALNSPNDILWWCDALRVKELIYGEWQFIKIYLIIIVSFILTVCIDHVRASVVNKIMKIGLIFRTCNMIDKSLLKIDLKRIIK